MLESHELVCIVCPIGCRLTVTELEDGNYSVEGNTCKRGEVYGIKELTAPTRVLPTTVKIIHSSLRRLPVKTNSAIPKELIFEAMKEINRITVEAPVRVGQVVIANLLGTGVDVVATRSMKAQE